MNQLIDPFGRTSEYLRISVTDRCDLRCSYFMSEGIEFYRAKTLCLSQSSMIYSNYKTGRLAVYFSLKNKKTKIDFIYPYSHNFCPDCNRVRITAVGRLLLCLGNEKSQDLRTLMRDGYDDQ